MRTHPVRRALAAGRTELHKRALKLVGYLVLAYLLLRLLPGLKQALHSLEGVRWEWVVGAIALEVLSEFGYVVSWRAIVDTENLLERDGRGIIYMPLAYKNYSFDSILPQLTDPATILSLSDGGAH